jgi:hypothetical protein
MWRSALMALLLAGCTQLPLTPEDIQARKFEPLPDKAVIYVVRDSPDFSDREAMIWLGTAATIKTYPGTYFRWEVAPGEHRIAGYGADIGVVAVKAEAGSIRVVQQRVAPIMSWVQSYFQEIDEKTGRAIVERSTLLEKR